MKIYILYVCVILLLGCILFYINRVEGFNSDYSDYTTIDRIKTSDNLYSYCLAGNISCPKGSLTTINDNYSGGKTYKYDCDSSGTYAECIDNFQYKGNKLNWYTPTRELSFPFSDVYKGFTVPYSYIPVDISGNYMNFYDQSGNIIDNVNKCDMLLTDTLADECKAALIKSTNPNTNTPTNASTNESTNTSTNSSTCTSSGKKCLANYGTKPGDPLCCGQTGVLQKWSSDYVCPSSAPTCSGYKCGEKYGTCS